jgi:hypothetical protein
MKSKKLNANQHSMIRSGVRKQSPEDVQGIKFTEEPRLDIPKVDESNSSKFKTIVLCL